MTPESPVCGRRIVIYVMAITYREPAGSENRCNKKGGGVVALVNERSIARQNRARVLGGGLPALGSERIAKRLFDIVASTTSLMLLSPIIFIVSAAIKLDSCGPVFSRETLYGYGNAIRAFKFRSVPACRETDQLESRFTRVGRIIRRAGIDELPQLLNVLRGEMSLVGPRPYSSRLDMLESQPLPNGFKLGMTSWAQVNEARDFRTTEQCINDDLHYIENWSLLLDFKIILMTVFSKNVPVS
jgi:lipopolysaccharide/colanic/teichoic acid biosynthesis glycosyltransferase